MDLPFASTQPTITNLELSFMKNNARWNKIVFNVINQISCQIDFVCNADIVNLFYKIKHFWIFESEDHKRLLSLNVEGWNLYNFLFPYSKLDSLDEIILRMIICIAYGNDDVDDDFRDSVEDFIGFLMERLGG